MIRSFAIFDSPSARCTQITHLPNGSFQFSSDQSQLNSIINSVRLRRNLVKLFGVWRLPYTHRVPGALAAIANGWQLSGSFTGGSGPTYDATYSYVSNGANVNITGSEQYAGRIRIVGNPGSGCSSNPFAQFNTAAFAGRSMAASENESGSNLLHGCADHTTNLSLARIFRIGSSEQRRLEFRLDGYHVFNAVVINARNTTMQLASPAAPTTILNNQYNADGTINQARLTPTNAGFGAATGAQAMRTFQLLFRFTF